ncbi:MAG: hypothetical protein ABGX26_06430 [Nautiliaceae bacterium]
MIWCNKDRQNFLSKVLKKHKKEVDYLKGLVERIEIDKDILELINELFLIDNNEDLKNFIKTNNFFEFKIDKNFDNRDFFENKDKVAYAIVEAILNKG